MDMGLPNYTPTSQPRLMLSDNTRMSCDYKHDKFIFIIIVITITTIMSVTEYLDRVSQVITLIELLCDTNCTIAHLNTRCQTT